MRYVSRRAAQGSWAREMGLQLSPAGDGAEDAGGAYTEEKRKASWMVRVFKVLGAGSEKCGRN